MASTARSFKAFAHDKVVCYRFRHDYVRQLLRVNVKLAIKYAGVLGQLQQSNHRTNYARFYRRLAILLAERLTKLSVEVGRSELTGDNPLEHRLALAEKR